MPSENEGAKRSQPDPRFSAPRLSLPKGGGAIHGIGEKFAANPVTGTGSLTVPIAVPPGRSGFGPQLSLSYDSGSGNGPFGFGWSLSLPSITRKTDKGLPRYHDTDESDVFILSGAEDLVPVLEEDDGEWLRVELARTVDGVGYRVHPYRPRTEGLFARIERWTAAATGETHWRSITRDNVTTLYGRDDGSRVFDPAHPGRVFQWLICESHDDRGNAIVYQYLAEDSTGVALEHVHERNRTPEDRTATRYPKRILYGNRVSRLAPAAPTDPGEPDWRFEVVFDYGEHGPVPTPDDAGPWLCRHDPFSSYRAGFEARTYRLCQRVLSFHHFPGARGVANGALVRSTDFTYRARSDAAEDRGRGEPAGSFLVSVTQRGFRGHATGYRRSALPPLEFTYSEAVIRDEVRELDRASLENLPRGVDGAFQWTDLDGEGLSGILAAQGQGWLYKRNLGGGRFGPAEAVATQPVAAAVGAGPQLLDLAGDGRLDLADFGGATPGFWERTDDGGWEPFRAFVSVPRLFWGDPDLKFVDLDGDGHADVLVTEGDSLVWYPSRAEEGFGAPHRVRLPVDGEERGPRLVFADGTGTVFLADMSGDGLSDLVRVRNGETCYWPSLGHGRFGARVTMDGSPWFDAPDHFDARRLRLADLDGSGTTDLVYLAADGVRLWFNQAGNRWSEPRRLSFPRVDAVSGVAVVDLLGTGTACLVWSSPLPAEAGQPLRYVELMAEKPHLLTGVRNNLGAETVVRYAPSTRFYLADRAAGRPWATRLSFPVHVVDRVETYDRVSRNRFVTRYAYHHGYFDGAEREFRGFGMVEQWDTEEIGALSAGDAFASADNLDAASHVPPVLTRTWFHTGAFFQADTLARRFAAEYWREPGADAADGDALLLPDAVLPATLLRADGTRDAWALSALEAREACRALRGSVLRQEVYALDGSEAQGRPYTVSERSWAAELLQPRRAGSRHAVFLPRGTETVELHYERALYDVDGERLADPRVSHTLTLEVDGWGNALRAAAVAYPRRHADPSLEQRDQDKQKALHATLTLSAFTPALADSAAHPDDHRAPLPSETRTYELRNAAPADVFFSLAELRALADAAGDGAHEVPYEDPDDPIVAAGAPCRRLIEHVRTLYRADDLSAALPLGQAEPCALPFEAYKLAFTPGLLASVYLRTRGGVTEDLLPDPAAVLGGEGGYASGDALRAQGRFPADDPDGCWWIPSGRVFHSPASGDSAAQELVEAREHFFLPRRFADAFGNETRVDYDAYDLLVAVTADAVGNTVFAENDYRVLQPALVTDPNGNRTAAAFDALGMVVATAVMGKEDGPAEGDFLDGFAPDPAADELLQYPFEDPWSKLGRATTRLFYDLFAYMNTPPGQDPRPVAVCTIARETHVADLPPWKATKIQQAFSFSDGFGREIQKKIQAEPGPVVEHGPDVSPRWVGSGWTVFNNKGKPVRRYEPFFSATAAFELARSEGVSAVLCYDPVERVVATLHPDHSWEKVVFDAWRQASWDGNDTVLLDPAADPDVGGFFTRLPAAEYLPTWHAARAQGQLGAREAQAAAKAEVHAGTPTVACVDTLGRAVLTVAHNRWETSDAPGVAHIGVHETRVEIDAEGNEREVTDALDRAVMRYAYDMLGNRVRQASMEAGTRWMLNDAAGKPMRGWDSRGHTIVTAYDALRRPTDVWVDDGAGPRVAERTEYGEGATDDVLRNLRGKPYRVFDGAGVVTHEAYDFKGNAARTTRQLLVDYRAEVDLGAAPVLERELFTTATRFDALGRVVQQVAPHSSRPGARLSVVQPAYNEANLLERLDAWLDQGAEPASLLDPATATVGAVTGLEHNARGQRTGIAYGNGARTRYVYDPLTFRLRRLVTTRGTAFPADCPEPPDALSPGCGVQDLAYTYDPAGNITHLADAAQQTVFFRNRRVDPEANYTYDALYRLIEATGREHLGQAPGGSPLAPVAGSDSDAPRVDLLHPGDGNAMGRYLQRYVYDRVGNFLQMIHLGSDPAHPGWTRAYAYAEPSLLEPAKVSNRLTSTQVGTAPAETYAHDAHGNLTSMPHLPLMGWDARDRLRATSRQVVGPGSLPDITWYVYDAAGERVRKVTDRTVVTSTVHDNDTMKPVRAKERIYLGGLEIYREYAADGLTVTLERETLHLMDDKQRVALVETRTQGHDPAPARLVRYQLANHLGSACLELDDDAQVITYEEYYPYGSTSYQAVRSRTETPKRYRYTGKERDDENAFSYHGARYYAPWLGRWASCDPKMQSYIRETPYGFVLDNPLKYSDPNGKEPFPHDGPGPFQSSFSASLTLGMNLGTHENRIFVKAEASATAFNIVQVNAGITTSSFASRFGRFESNYRGYEAGITVGAAIGYNPVAMAGWSTTWHKAKSESEVFRGKTSTSTTGDPMSQTNQRTANIAIRVGSPKGWNVTLSSHNDTEFFLGDKGDSYRTGGGIFKVQTPQFTTGISTLTRFELGVEFNMVTGYVDRSKIDCSKGPLCQGQYIMNGPHKDLSQGALSLNFGVDHLSFDSATGLGTLTQGSIKAGRDSEKIRTGVQNDIIHDRLGIAHVPAVEGRMPRNYFNAEFSRSTLLDTSLKD